MSLFDLPCRAQSTAARPAPWGLARPLGCLVPQMRTQLQSPCRPVLVSPARGTRRWSAGRQSALAQRPAVSRGRPPPRQTSPCSALPIGPRRGRAAVPPGWPGHWWVHP
ncbi:hypothetical protein I4F81_007052 [Pyropia yezoensis]|uniref:Uncharacterized protein n=1 Tax=Pyropia yezoensis TaxID=2788 RepID=A0ACC3C3G1_PYRYE|nr:hypothetical protein I4F81_007052 [Neopyropia yezoensis]